MNSKLTQIKVFYIQSESLRNREAEIGEDILEAIITNEYINFETEDSSEGLLVSPNKIRVGGERAGTTLWEGRIY